MAGVLDRRCATCKIKTTHTRGMHVVTHEASRYFCSNKCQKNFSRHNRKKCNLKDRNTITATQPQLQAANPDWLKLPGDVIWLIQSQLELGDLLNMGQTCRSWFSSMCPAIHSMVFTASTDERTWSHTVWLLQHMLPHIHTLALEFPDLELTSDQIQTLSHCKQLQHLSLNIKGNGQSWYMHPTYMWMPALARLTALRSLEVVAPNNCSLDMASLSCLTSLTSLRILSHDSADAIYSYSPAEEEFEGLQQLPHLQILEYPDELLPHLNISTLTSLTSLTIHNVDVHFHGHENVHLLQAYADSYLQGIASLPCLHKLCLDTMNVSLHSLRSSTSAADQAAASAGFIAACAKHLCQVPELELHISDLIKLEACSAIFHSLAKLTNLTTLAATFTDTHPSLNLAHLWPLRRLRHLSLSFYGFGAVQQVNNELWIWDRDLRGLFRPLNQLTKLHLGLRPLWFLNPEGLMQLTHLTGLKELSVALPPDDYVEKRSEVVLELPLACLPESVVNVELDGYALKGCGQMARQESSSAEVVIERAESLKVGHDVIAEVMDSALLVAQAS